MSWPPGRIDVNTIQPWKAAVPVGGAAQVAEGGVVVVGIGAAVAWGRCVALGEMVVRRTTPHPVVKARRRRREQAVVSLTERFEIMTDTLFEA